MKRAIVFSLLALAACAPQRIPVNATFDPQAVSFVMGPGNGVISGQAFMRQMGGGVVTCAGETMALIPVARYSTERMMIIYGNVERGVASLFGPTPEDAPADYTRYQKMATCDAQGNFRFEQVPAGQYYLVGGVRWMAGNMPQGGRLMRRVTVAPGQSQSVLLSS